MLRDHGIELRRFVAQSLRPARGTDHQRSARPDGRRPRSGPVLACQSPRPRGPRPARPRGATLWLTAVAAAIALFSGVLWYHAANDTTDGIEQGQGCAPRGRPRRSADRASARSPRRRVVAAEIARSAAARNAAIMVEPVPYGESPFAGARIDAVQNILARRWPPDFRGTVEIRSIPGRFCLQGRRYSHAAGRRSWVSRSAIRSEIRSIPVAWQAVNRWRLPTCSVPSTVTATAHLTCSLPRVAATRWWSNPVASAVLTAGEWNRVAAANNRVEVRARPLP